MRNPSSVVVILTDERIETLRFVGRANEIASRSTIEYRLPHLGAAEFVEHEVDELAEAIARSIAPVPGQNSPLILVIPLSWCFSHVIEPPAKRATAETLAFAFEQFLPVPLEDLTCAFAPLAEGQVLAVAVPTTPVQTLLERLAQRGLEVARLLVDVVTLALSTADREAAVLDARWLKIIAQPNGKFIVATIGLPEERSKSALLAEQLAMRGLNPWMQEHNVLIADLGPSEDDQPKLQAVETLYGNEAIERLGRAANQCSATADLRSGALAAPGRWNEALRLIRQHLLLAAAMIAIFIVGARWESHRLAKSLAASEAEKAAIYREVFSTPLVPSGAATRLASERIRLEGLTRHQRSPTLPATRPLNILRDFVVLLPSQVRVNLLEARLDPLQCRLRGHTAEHGDAERISDALERVEAVSARAPRTRRLDSGGVEFTLVATAETRP